MKKHYICIFFFFAIANFFYAKAQACSCVGKKSVKKSYKSSVGIFTGTILTIDTVTVTDTIFKNYYNDSLY